MTHNITIQGAELVPIRDLKPYPGNARRGNVDSIADSLAHHGQYRPIVIDQNNTILAGHHVVQAAKRLRWKSIAAVQINVNDTQAARIVIADNRIADLATYDNTTLLELIENLPDLDGTGYGPADIAQLDALIGGDTPDTPDTPSPPSEPDPLTPTIQIQLGPLYSHELPRDTYDAWLDTFFNGDSRGQVIKTLKDWLDLPTPPKPDKEVPKFMGLTETVPITDIQVHPNNAREGDIGQLTESLRVNGQYRPIIANRASARIVVGNHTYLAARALGWDRIAVHWIDVDPIEETKILLVDNRTSDLATYDTNALKALVTSINHAGTGYTPEDLNDLITGSPAKPGPPPTGQTNMRIGDYGWKTPTDLYDQWADNLTLDTILTRLHLTQPQ